MIGARALHTVEDDSLVRALAEGDELALAELYRRFGGTAYRVAHRVLRDASLAEDAVQEAFLGVWRAAAAYDGARASVSSWLLTLVHRRSVDLVRRAERHRTVPMEGVDVVENESTEDNALAQLERRRVHQALQGLPEGQRTLLELAYYGGLTQSQIAERLGQPLGTVKSRTFVALAQLREALTSQPPGTLRGLYGSGRLYGA